MCSFNQRHYTLIVMKRPVFWDLNSYRPTSQRNFFFWSLDWLYIFYTSFSTPLFGILVHTLIPTNWKICAPFVLILSFLSSITFMRALRQLKLRNWRKSRYHLDALFCIKFNMVLNSVLFWKLLVIDFLLNASISETLLCSVSASQV